MECFPKLPMTRKSFSDFDYGILWTYFLGLKDFFPEVTVSDASVIYGQEEIQFERILSQKEIPSPSLEPIMRFGYHLGQCEYYGAAVRSNASELLLITEIRNQSITDTHVINMQNCFCDSRSILMDRCFPFPEKVS